jgi:glycosyltransferase involved in cell wall biosynthesis
LKKVLTIAHQFPPVASSGSFRPAKFVKYLPQYNWQPYVITTGRISSIGFDQTLTEDIPESASIFRITSPFPKPRDRVIKWLGKYSPILKDEIKRAFDKEQKPQSTVERGLRLFLRIVFFPLTLVQYPPIDPVIYWSLKIISPAYRLIKKQDIDVIFTTSAPWSAMISGLTLKKLTGRPWVADMRDPWTTEELRYGSKSWRRLIDKYSERLLLKKADIIVGVTPGWLNDLKRLAGEENVEGKYELITNGYDESDFAGYPLPNLKFENEILLSHVGSMFEGGLEPLLMSLQNVNGSLLDRLRIELIGYIHPSDQKSLAKSPAQGSFIYQSQRITHVESLEKMRSSHVLLLSLPLEYYPGKVFEYMRVGRPVLAIVPEGSVSRLVKKAQIGPVLKRDDSEGIIGVLGQIVDDYDEFVSQYYQPDWEFICQFERETLSKKLSNIFDRISKK